MSKNRLQYFILFHLFRLPIIIWAAAIALALAACGILAKNQTCRYIIQNRKAINLRAIQQYGLFLVSPLKPEQIKTQVLERYKVQALQDQNPLRLKTKSLDEIKTLESLGVRLLKISHTNDSYDAVVDTHVLIPLLPYE